MGVPQRLKTDNGPAYISMTVAQFLRTWGVQHTTGIPNSPTGQAIVERANRTLKQYLEKYQEELVPQAKLLRCLFVLNHLCVFGKQEFPPAMVHFGSNKEKLEQEVFVHYRNPKTGIWEGSAKVLFWGRGYLCVSTSAGMIWVPAKWTWPANQK